MILDKKTLLEAAKLALQNAEELSNEAELLLKNKHFSRAFTLYQLSIEETGKSAILFNSVLFNQFKTPSDKAKILKEIKDHKVKTKVSQGIDLVLAMVTEDYEIKKSLLNNALTQHKEINKINNFKNYSLYLSIIDNKFIKPSEIINKKLAEEFKFYAKIRLNATRQYQESMSSKFEEIAKRIQDIDKDDLLKNPPESIKELLALIDN